MVTSTTQGVLVEAPVVEPAPGGLLRAFPPKPFEKPQMGRWGVYYESENCGEIVDHLEDAAEQLCGDTAEKRFAEGRGDLVFSDIHTIYAGKTCNLVGGFIQNEAQRLVELELERTGSIALERHLWSAVFAEQGVDLTPGAAVKPKRGLAILEEWAGERYGVVPVVHAGRQASVYLAGETLLTDDADKAAASGGALYVNGGGYTSKIGPGAVEAGPNEAWMYITGWIEIRRGEIITRDEPVVTPKKNLGYVLAERTYVTTVECLVGAIRVTLE
jgi:hypothetical protein